MKHENKCILPLQNLVEMNVNGVTHRFKVSRHYPSMGYEFTCVSEGPTSYYDGKIIPMELVKQAKEKRLIKIL